MQKFDLVIEEIDNSFSGWKQLSTLIQAAYAEHVSQGLGFAASQNDEEAMRKRCQGKRCFIARIANPDDPDVGQIVGTILYEFPKGQEVKNWRWWKNSWYSLPISMASFSQFAVSPKHRGLKIGSVLLDQIEATAKEEGAEQVAADTAADATQLIGMYLKRGYRLVDYLSWSNTNYYSVVFCRNVAGEFDPQQDHKNFLRRKMLCRILYSKNGGRFFTEFARRLKQVAHRLVKGSS